MTLLSGSDLGAFALDVPFDQNPLILDFQGAKLQLILQQALPSLQLLPSLTDPGALRLASGVLLRASC